MRHMKWGAALIGAAMLASLPAAAEKTVENYKSVTDKELRNSESGRLADVAADA